MPLVDEELKLVASVSDRASGTLESVEESLRDVGRTARDLFQGPDKITADVDTARAKRKIESIENDLEDLEQTYHANVAVTQVGGGRPRDRIDRAFGLGGGGGGGNPLDSLEDTISTKLDDIDRSLGDLDERVTHEMRRVDDSVTHLGTSLETDMPTPQQAMASGGTRDASATNLRRTMEDLQDTVDEDIDFTSRRRLGRALIEGDNVGVADMIDSEIIGEGLADAVMDDEIRLDLDDVDALFGRGDTDLDEGVTAFGRAVSADSNIFGFDRGPLESIQNFELGMNDIYRVVAALVPLLLVFVGALPALIGGVVALAGAAVAAAASLAGLAGLAVMGAGMEGGEFSLDNLSEEISRIRESFVDAFAPLAKQLAPLVDEFSRGLDNFFRDMAARGDVLIQLRNTVSRLMSSLDGDIAPFLETMVASANAAMPLFSALLGGVFDPQWIESFANFLGDILPTLNLFAGVIATLVVQIVKLSQGFLLVASIVAGVFVILLKILGVFDGLLPVIGALISLILVAASASALWTLATNSLLTSIGNAISAIIVKVFVIYTQYLPATASAILATLTFAAALGILLGIITFGIAPAIGGLSSQFGLLGGNIGDATKQLKKFDSTRSGMSGLGGTAVGGGNTTVRYEDYSTTEVHAHGRNSASKAAEVESYENGDRTNLNSYFNR